MFKYSKKVMQHFLHPKNVGSIKNADAIGKAGNIYCGDIMQIYLKIEKGKIKDVKFKTLGCLPPTEEISSGNKWIDIANVSKGDIVLNGNGEKVKVKHVHNKVYKGDLIKIIPFVSGFNSFSVTPVHPVLCIKRKFLESSRKCGKCDWLRVKERELISSKPCYVEAEYIEPGDYLIFPKKREIKDKPEFTKDLMKLIGWYLAEGYVTSKKVLNFAFNENKKENISEVKELLKKVVGKYGSQRTRGRVTELRVCSTKWCKFFVEICGKYAKNKRLSDKVLSLPFEKQWEMIKAYIKGDGNIYKRCEKDSVTYRINTTSRQLAIQIQEILARGNIFASIKKFERPANYIEGRKLPPHTLFNISFRLKRKHKFIKENENHFLIPVKKIELEPYHGKVYNLEVNGKNPSYLVKGFVVHNCAAAIATSSMITEIVKGKTLKKALEITSMQLAKKLGGLPPIKIHCSVLATDALAEAIYSYYEKHKMQIPSELKRRHEKIIKEMKETERRYKEFVKTQRKWIR